MQDSNLYHAMGGTFTCRKLSSAFYARVEHDPVLRPLFPGTTLRCAIEEFAAFLVQFLGGPTEDTQRRWWVSLRESHLRFKLGPKERTAWINNMTKALEDVPIAEPVRSTLLGFFERSSAYVVNQGKVPTTEERDEPPSDRMRQEIARRWNAQRRLDEIVAAVRSGDADRARALAEAADSEVPDFAVSA